MILSSRWNLESDGMLNGLDLFSGKTPSEGSVHAIDGIRFFYRGWRCGLSKSGCIGVYFHKASQKWRAQIRIGNDIIHIGLFDDKYQAARAYDKRARRAGKKILNFVDPKD